jgi:hypothetical protein
MGVNTSKVVEGEKVSDPLTSGELGFNINKGAEWNRAGQCLGT